MGIEEYGVEGKVAIVTGAGRGIGKVIALTLAEAGAHIAAVARTSEQVEQTAEDVRKLGRRGIAITTDVAIEDQVKRAVEQTIEQFGRIDILCHSAGIGGGFSPVVTLPVSLDTWQADASQGKPLTLEDWHQIIDTNLTSAFLLAQAVGPHMLKQRKGKVINITSTCGDEGMPCMSAYSASKAGLSVFTRCLASEWAPFNINVNAIAPGMIRTPLSEPLLKDLKTMQTLLHVIPAGRIGDPHDIASLALFLASEASNYITGEIITVDGGAMGRGPGI